MPCAESRTSLFASEAGMLCYMPLLAETKKGENTGRMNDRRENKLIVKSCADCIPADMYCQISVECKRQRREKQKKENNMAKEFFKGDKVWIYDSPCEPRLATIVCKMSQVEAYQVEYKEGREKLRVYGVHNIFEYPDGLNRMVCKMSDDAFYLAKMAKEFENNPIMWVE